MDQDVIASLERLRPLHHQLCPRQVLGVRMGLHAGELLGLELPRSDKRLLAFVETDGCLTDGLAVATGCRVGRRTLRVVDFGKVAATVVDTATERAVRLMPHAQARRRAVELVPGAASRWHAQLEAYQTMPAFELLRVEGVTLMLSLQAIVSHAGARVPCQACGEEIMNEREVALGGRTLCRGCAGERYYAPLAESILPAASTSLAR